MAAPKFCGRDRLSAAEFAASSVEAILALAKFGIAIVSPFYEGFADSGVPDRAAWLSASSCVPVYPEEPCQGLSCSASKWEKAKVVACDVALALGHNAAARLALVTGVTGVNDGHRPHQLGRDLAPFRVAGTASGSVQSVDVSASAAEPGCDQQDSAATRLLLPGRDRDCTGCSLTAAFDGWPRFGLESHDGADDARRVSQTTVTASAPADAADADLCAERGCPSVDTGDEASSSPATVLDAGLRARRAEAEVQAGGIAPAAVALPASVAFNALPVRLSHFEPTAPRDAAVFCNAVLVVDISGLPALPGEAGPVQRSGTSSPGDVPSRHRVPRGGVGDGGALRPQRGKGADATAGTRGLAEDASRPRHTSLDLDTERALSDPGAALGTLSQPAGARTGLSARNAPTASSAISWLVRDGDTSGHASAAPARHPEPASSALAVSASFSAGGMPHAPERSEYASAPGAYGSYGDAAVPSGHAYSLPSFSGSFGIGASSGGTAGADASGGAGGDSRPTADSRGLPFSGGHVLPVAAEYMHYGAPPASAALGPGLFAGPAAGGGGQPMAAQSGAGSGFGGLRGGGPSPGGMHTAHGPMILTRAECKRLDTRALAAHVHFVCTQPPGMLDVAAMRDALRELQDRTHTRLADVLRTMKDVGYPEVAALALGAALAQDPLSLTYALQTVTNLGMQEGMRSRLGACGCIEAAARCLAPESKQQLRAVKDAIVALRHLAYENDDNKIRIIESGAMALTVDSMARFRESPQVQKQACKALKIFAVHTRRGDDVKHAVLAAGGVSALLHCLYSYHSDTQVATAALEAIATLCHLREARQVAARLHAARLLQDVSAFAYQTGDRHVQEACRVASIKLSM
ncbi:hypothetical protein FNF29_02680 [Cafeteria roenbergensis]|uniref:Armadillo repeat-containing domain-containing protein n=1 Tax=Cafeteria roenbergensis TaxID=33653 RepID=A0A5A8CNG9_CAFRO|nr:hypothetical protein FNF29_02680 [Cafeteria roenbergensis]|eukprot:KAA0154057.1 hypothetical protein FNF29_02680 [Cafeteria roenbergensis]